MLNRTLDRQAGASYFGRGLLELPKLSQPRGGLNNQDTFTLPLGVQAFGS
jgi:hypothetical protein